MEGHLRGTGTPQFGDRLRPPPEGVRSADPLCAAGTLRVCVTLRVSTCPSCRCFTIGATPCGGTLGC